MGEDGRGGKFILEEVYQHIHNHRKSLIGLAFLGISSLILA